MTSNRNIYRIQRFSIHDGPGIRTTLFFQGCPLACIWCHNPESQATVKPDIGSGPEEVCSDLMAEIRKDRMFYEQSGGGVTFSGGEPLMQAVLLKHLARQCRQEGIHTCLDTSGYAPLHILKDLWTDFDLILYDLKLFNNDAHIRYTGRPFQFVGENLVFLSEMKACVKLRFPLIPGITDTALNLETIRRFVTEKTTFRNIHILPLHQTAEAKYRQLNLENKIKHLEIPEEKHIERVAQTFDSGGFEVIIGG